MINYMAELSLLMSQMGCGKSIKEHPAVFRASKHRIILERIRPIEQKMKSQIDKLTQSTHNGEVKTPLRARPDQMEFDDESDAEESEEDEGGEEKKTKKYVPPKMVAVRYEEEDNEKQTKAMERAKRRALQSSLVQELRQQYSDAPEEYREKSRRKFEADKERQRYEEDHFVRLRMSKAEKKRERLQNRDNAIDDLFNFGNYMMRDESGEALSNSKKRKGSQSGGPKGKKSRFDRKKSKKLKAKLKKTVKTKARLILVVNIESQFSCQKRPIFAQLTSDGSYAGKMAGHFESELCQVLLEEHFGKTVSLVASVLLREPGPLGAIMFRLKGQVKLNAVRKSLSILIQHSIVTFKMDASMRVNYSIDRSAILAFPKAPRCCLIVKTLYGGLAEAICEELFSYGRLTCSDTIRKVSLRLEQPLGDVKEKFCRLTEAQFIARCPPVVSSLKGCPQFETSYDPFIMPDVILQGSSESAGESRKRKAPTPEGDEGIYWHINWSRFDRYIRDEMTLELLVPKNSSTEQIALKLSQTVRSLLKANEVRASPVATINTAPISLFDMMRTVKENELEIERPDVEKSLRILVDESRGVVRRSGDSGGGLFVIDFERAIGQICQFHIESLIREQLESRAVRIFRLLQQRGHLEEDQIEKLTMMSGKETRELLYAMLEEGYISTKPIGRTNDFAPSRTFVLYYVDMPQTVRGLVEYTCKMLRNIILRRSFEVKEHRLLTERQVKMESIMETINADETLDEETKKQQISEVEEMYLSSADRAALEKYHKAQTVLNAAETECERALFAFRLYIEFSLRRC
ncbi:RNA polymerase III subunit RPC82 helix-turn-helix protein [Oesophagostomum dentatum]|uniref:DNA-directed RNA polymerase III subunit RPC3 n=1 Tax=Oesophagostomum dentatum TaxID=61180 RepID=A0A0B1TS69_OESDE|nr:RNA polymerase III subunit RPC82 helix-turn-helix protein [Oesophagostomum dentatum]